MRVPLMWTASIDEEPMDRSVDLNRLPVWLVSAEKVYGQISLGPWDYPSKESPEQVSKDWTVVFWTLHSATDDVVTGPMEIKLNSGGPARCMESAYRTAPNAVTVSCLLFQRKWKAEFIGDKRDIGVFFYLIRNLD